MSMLTVCNTSEEDETGVVHGLCVFQGRSTANQRIESWWGSTGDRTQAIGWTASRSSRQLETLMGIS